MTEYSEELIARVAKNFAENHRQHIGRDKAVEYLNSTARLYLAFARSETRSDQSTTIHIAELDKS